MDYSEDDTTQPAGSGLAPETVAVTAGRPPHEVDAPLNNPLTPASTFVAGGEREYGRYANPTWNAFEEVLGRLEGGRALTYASGLAAVSAIADLITPGEKVVVPRHAYLGVLTILTEREQRGLLKLARVDIADTDQVVAACDDAAIVWLESPTNPMLEVADIQTISTAAHDAGARVVVDNTFATPLVQRPLELGADIVVHSATKYLAGHSDAVIGAVVTADGPAGNEIYTALEQRRSTLGSIPGVFESWLAARGVRTLHLRLERSQSNAVELARRLEAHPSIERVRYPGFGSMLAIEVRGGAPAADLLTRSGSLWVHATSLGGVESTWERRRRWASEPDTVPENLVRMSVGVEDVEDLWHDLDVSLGRL